MLREAGERMIGSGGMRVYTVEVGGAIVSVEILFAAGGEVASWNTGWDPAWAEERVSMAGLFAAIEDCFTRGDARLDFGEGTQPYKAAPRGRRRPGGLGHRARPAGPPTPRPAPSRPGTAGGARRAARRGGCPSPRWRGCDP